MFRMHLARALVIASLGLSSGCLCCGDHPLLDRFRRGSECACGGGCGCGQVAGFAQEGPVLQDIGPSLTPIPGAPNGCGCGTLVPQGTPLPMGAPPGVRIEPRPAQTEPYRSPMP